MCCIGPITEFGFWEGEKTEMELNRGTGSCVRQALLTKGMSTEDHWKQSITKPEK